MKYFGWIISAGLAALSLQSCHNQSKSGIAISGKEEFADSALSVVRQYTDASGRQIIHKSNTTYDLVDFTDREDVKKLLVKVTNTEVSSVDSGVIDNRYTVSVSGINDEKIHWTKEFKGADLDYTYKVLVVHTEGKNSNEEDTYTQYSMQTGEKLMSFTYSSLMAQIVNTSNKRFFGYLSGQSATDEKPEKFATISYVGSNEKLDKINIIVKGNKTLPAYTPEISLLASQESGNTVASEGKVVILAKTDRTFKPEDINGFAMKISYQLPDGTATMILLPIRQDHIDLENANYDKAIFEIVKAG
ncbi:MAG: hypothetical protein JST83_07965 [Bacteroidetes bacterium]|nr:hypothetical protein [Bacteroidota bacterium]